MSGEGQLPDGWVWTTLNDLALSVRNGIFISRPGTEPSGTPILRIGSVRSLRLDLEDVRYTGLPADSEAIEGSLLRPGDLLFTRYNGNPEFVGSCAVVPPGISHLTYPDKLIRVVIDERLALPEFVASACAVGPTRDAIRRSVKTTAGQAGISGRELRAVPIPLPPLAEQRRIVEALEEHLSRLDAGRHTLASAATRMRSLQKNLLHQAVCGQLCELSGNSADEMAAIAKHRNMMTGAKKELKPVSALPHYRLPVGWAIASLDAICYDSGYGTSIKCDYTGPGAAVLRIPNVQHGTIDESDLKYAVSSSADLSAHYVAPGDLLFVRTNGSRDLIGRVGVVDRTMNAAFASYLIRFRPVPNGVDPAWVRAVVSSPLWRQFLEAAAASSAGQLNLNSQTLGSLPIPVPPKATQRAILLELDRYASAGRELESELDRANRRSSHLKRALLARAFSGQLVPQDSAEEPASELLARIEAERASLPTGEAKLVRRARTTATTVRAPKETTTVPVGVQEELPL